MKAIAITDRGIEKVTLMEIKQLAGVKGISEDAVVVFECDDNSRILDFCYKAQSIDRVLALLGSFDFSDIEDLLEGAKSIIAQESLGQWFSEGISFKVECERRGFHDFASQEVEQEVGGIIIEKVTEELGYEPPVNMKAPDVRFYVFINDQKAYIGIDLIGRDLSKRQYRIFTAPGTVNAKLAYAMVRLSGYAKNMKMVDLSCRSGIICIEASLYASLFSINHYDKDFSFKKLKPFSGFDWDDFFKKIDSEDKPDKLGILGLDPMLRNLEAAKKNAKLAGIDKTISFSKMDLEWLDVKLEEKSIDLVVSRISCPSHAHPENAVRKSYKEIFYQAEFFLKKKGRMCLLSESLSLFREMLTADFRIIEEHELFAGKQRYEMIILEKA